ncbi:MAG: DegT/DnrJ/EryC1/StrS family aminotransferase [Cyclobacteriaceae bacterium]|nr:DegT/DnrJ/EryC1/StrS family aminotransferase [Cyclobacteriaceae bacterium]
MFKIPLSYNEIDAKALYEVLLKYQNLNHEELVLDLEKLASSRLLNKPVVALSSGTAAVHLALMALGIGSGDWVVVPTFSYVASVNPVLYTGAKPVWVDSEPTTWNLCPVLLEQALRKFNARTKRIKAIIVVHNYGVPADMARIQEVAKQYGVPIIEDAAEAWGASIQNEPCGTLGDIGVFSFNNNKTITAFGGGLITTSNSKWEKRIRLLAAQARLPKSYYVFNEVGYNYRISPLTAAYGLSQIQRDKEYVSSRQQVFGQYCKQLLPIEGLTSAMALDGHIASRWLSAFRFPKRTKVKEFVKLSDNQRIEVRIGWNPLHRMKHLSGYPTFLNGTAEALFKEVFCLPSGQNLTQSEQENIIIALRHSLGYK